MDQKSHDIYFQEFTKPVRRIGKVTLLLGILLGFIPAVYIALRYNAMPTTTEILGGYVMILSTEMSNYFIEPISYFPVLGEAGTYMSFLSGSIGGIRVPTVAESQAAVGTEPGSKKAEIVSSIAIAASVVCSMTMGFIAIVLGNVLFSIIPVFVQGMFGYVLPALYGTLAMMYIPRKPIVAVFAVVVSLILRLTAIVPNFLNMLIVVILTVGFGVYLAKRDMKKEGN